MVKKISIFLLFSIFSFAQNANRKYISHSLNNNNLEIKVSDGNYFIHFKNDFIAETTFVPNNEKLNTNSHALILKDKIGFTVQNKKEFVQINSKLLSVKVNFNPFQITYLKEGKPIVSEKTGYYKKKHIALDHVKDNIVSDSTEVIQFNITSNEVLYGGGARVLGMNRRGNKLALYNRAHYGYETKAELMNFCIPLAISSNQYAIHFDNAAIGYLDLDSQKNNTLEYETISGRKTYQVIIGNSWENLNTNYAKLTGFQPLPAIWTLGNFASRFGYKSQFETEKTIQKFRNEKIPLDAIILDLYWFGKTIQGTMGNLEIDRDSFPDFEKMVQNNLNSKVKTITITEPFILTTSKKWNEAKNENILATKADGTPATWDFYFGNTALIDVFKPKGQTWFWNIYKDLANKGISGVWGDLGEPEVFPSFANTAAGKADEVHNIYGHQWAKTVFEGYKKDFPTQRPFILMRAGYSGSQRYGIIPWSGDVNRTWGGLSGQTEIALQMGMQGLGYMHSDLGGFAGNLLDDELYIRWLQYGVFNPIFRPHAQDDLAAEPVFRSDFAKNLAKKAIELRYQLLPYNYNLAYENASKGLPLMRPVFYYDTNAKFNTTNENYYWGKDFLVSPIINKSQKTKTINFTENCNWFDFYTNKKYKGNTSSEIAITDQNIPTFVRGGAFIPTTKIIQSTAGYNTNELIIQYFYDKEVKQSSNEFYFDDGTTANNIENKNFEKVIFTSKNLSNKIKINIQVLPEANYKSTSKKYSFILKNLNTKPKKVYCNNLEIPFTYNAENLEIILPVFNLKTSIETQL